MKTEAAVLTELGQPIDLMEVEIPPLKPGQVLIDIAYSGVCHSQLNEARGRKGPDRYLPHLLGHEGSGTVVEIGPDVTKVAPGDPVVLSWIKGSGADVPSTVYHSAIGPVNSGAICTFMRRTVTCENRVTRLAPELPMKEAALLGCAVPTGAGMVLNTARTKAGDSVAVFGVGGIGLSALMAAKAVGAEMIVAIDVVASKLDAARRFGATHTINAMDTDAVAAVREMTGGAGVDAAIEAAGRPETMEAAFRSVRDGGGLAVLAGNVAAGQTMCLDPYDLIRGKRILGSWGGDTDPDRDFPRYGEMYTQGTLPLSELVSDMYTLADINAALDDLENGKALRPLIEM